MEFIRDPAKTRFWWVKVNPKPSNLRCRGSQALHQPALNTKPYPRGSEYPNSTVLGPKNHTLNGFWKLKPYYLGTWTLRVYGSFRK